MVLSKISVCDGCHVIVGCQLSRPGELALAVVGPRSREFNPVQPRRVICGASGSELQL